MVRGAQAIGARGQSANNRFERSRGRVDANIVDDSPIRLSEWLPLVAKLLDAPAPGHMDEAAAREKLGDVRVYYMNEQRGASNAKAKREFNWQPAFPSCRTGFEALYLNRPRGSVDASHCAS